MQTCMEWWKRENQNMGEKRLTMVLSKSETIIKRGAPLNSIAGLSPFKVFLLLSVSKLVKNQKAFESAQAQKTQIRKFCNNNNLSQRQRESLMEGRKRISRPLTRKNARLLKNCNKISWWKSQNIAFSLKPRNYWSCQLMVDGQALASQNRSFCKKIAAKNWGTLQICFKTRGTYKLLQNRDFATQKNCSKRELLEILLQICHTPTSV